MARDPRFRVLSGLLVAAAWLAPCGLLTLREGDFRARAQSTRSATDSGQEPDQGTVTKSARDRTTRSRATQKKSRQGKEKPAAAAEKPAPSPAQETATSRDAISFKQEVAPILVANCVGCHSQGRPGLTRGKLDLTSFEKLMKGTPKEKVITPGKPDESHLVLRVRGEEQPRMPQGGNNNGLADEAISRIERWVAAGAVLDAGLDPKATIESYAASPEQIRRNLLAKLGAKEREQLVEKAGRDRWKKANPALTPEIHHGEHFVLFSNLPKERAAGAIKLLEAQHGLLRRLLGPQPTNWVEKVSVYVFNSRKDFVELVRTIENREPEAEVAGTGSLTVAQPFLAVVDPLGGKREDPAAHRRRPRTRKGEEEAEMPARGLAALLAQTLGEAAVGSYGKSPRWLAYGLGESLGAQAEPRSPFYRGLGRLAHQKYDQGWITRATDVLGETENVSPEEMRAISLAIVESLLSPELRAAFPAFAKGMSQGKEKFDDVLKDVYGVSREDFLNTTGDWIARHYGQGE